MYLFYHYPLPSHPGGLDGGGFSVGLVLRRGCIIIRFSFPFILFAVVDAVQIFDFSHLLLGALG